MARDTLNGTSSYTTTFADEARARLEALNPKESSLLEQVKDKVKDLFGWKKEEVEDRLDEPVTQKETERNNAEFNMLLNHQKLSEYNFVLSEKGIENTGYAYHGEPRKFTDQCLQWKLNAANKKAVEDPMQYRLDMEELLDFQERMKAPEEPEARLIQFGRWKNDERIEGRENYPEEDKLIEAFGRIEAPLSWRKADDTPLQWDSQTRKEAEQYCNDYTGNQGQIAQWLLTARDEGDLTNLEAQMLRMASDGACESAKRIERELNQTGEVRPETLLQHLGHREQIDYLIQGKSDADITKGKEATLEAELRQIVEAASGERTAFDYTSREGQTTVQAEFRANWQSVADKMESIEEWARSRVTDPEQLYLRLLQLDTVYLDTELTKAFRDDWNREMRIQEIFATSDMLMEIHLEHEASPKDKYALVPENENNYETTATHAREGTLPKDDPFHPDMMRKASEATETWLGRLDDATPTFTSMTYNEVGETIRENTTQDERTILRDRLLRLQAVGEVVNDSREKMNVSLMMSYIADQRTVEKILQRKGWTWEES